MSEQRTSEPRAKPAGKGGPAAVRVGGPAQTLRALTAGTRADADPLAGPVPPSAAGHAEAPPVLQPRLGVAGLDRRTLALIATVLVLGWLVLVFGRAIAQSNQASAEAAALRVQDTALSQQVADRQAELTVIQSPAFLALEARAYGYGSAHEQVFALQPGAPPPPAIMPLGAAPSSPPPPSPLQSWLQLLFGD